MNNPTCIECGVELSRYDLALYGDDLCSTCSEEAHGLEARRLTRAGETLRQSGIGPVE